jgi:dienelactone hydrolase
MQDSFDYMDGETACEGFIAWDERKSGPRPCVLVAHQWAGLSDHERETAVALSERGYFAFAIDVYGKGIRGGPSSDNGALMAPWTADRAKLRTRLLAAVTAAQTRSEVDPARIGVVGFCFGGLCALDLARSGDPRVKAAVSIHGVFAPPNLGPQGPITASVLVLHGYADPLAPPKDVLALADELTGAKADWQIHAYGHAMHAFTAQEANAPEMGLLYDRKAASRARWAQERFLQEVLGE